jgi:hypothetical protein
VKFTSNALRQQVEKRGGLNNNEKLRKRMTNTSVLNKFKSNLFARASNIINLQKQSTIRVDPSSFIQGARGNTT